MSNDLPQLKDHPAFTSKGREEVPENTTAEQWARAAQNINDIEAMNQVMRKSR